MKVWLRFVFFFLLSGGLISNFYGCGWEPGDGQQEYTKVELVLLAANDYIDEFTYISGWYNRENKDDLIGTHHNNCGVAYSYYSDDPPGYFEAKIDSSDEGVTRWCDYNPYRPAAGWWDVDDGYWTGTHCQALVYHCCSYAEYSFTSNLDYLARVTEWDDPSIGQIITDKSQGQIGDVILVDFENTGYVNHIGIVSDVSSSNYEEFKIIQAIGWYGDFEYKAKEKLIGDLYGHGYEVEFKYLRLYNQ